MISTNFCQEKTVISVLTVILISVNGLRLEPRPVWCCCSPWLPGVTNKIHALRTLHVTTKNSGKKYTKTSFDITCETCDTCELWYEFCASIHGEISSSD